VRLTWTVGPEDVRKVQAVVHQAKDNRIVKRRLSNVARPRPVLDDDAWWKAQVAGVFSSNQPSGPQGRLSALLSAKRFAFGAKQVRAMTRAQLSRAISKAGIRWGNRKAAFLHENLGWLDDGGWTQLGIWRKELLGADVKDASARTAVERRMARETAHALYGVGPKQSRNIWQMLGFFQYELPIDVRIIAWMNKLPFPLKLSAAGLQDPDYYEFCLDGIQRLCREANVVPCVFDAAIFTKGGTDDLSDSSWFY
jgi:hypothetical protein